jgi:hypothetical protein
VQGSARQVGIFESKIVGLSESTDRQKIVLQLLVVFVLASGAANINQHSDVV